MGGPQCLAIIHCMISIARIMKHVSALTAAKEAQTNLNSTLQSWLGLGLGLGLPAEPIDSIDTLLGIPLRLPKLTLT